MNLLQEFDRQVQTLIDKGYPKIANVSEEEFLNMLEPLKKKIETVDVSDIDVDRGYLPFVIVITSDVVPIDIAMSLVDKDGKAGITKLFPHEPKDFSAIPEVSIPATYAYVLLDIDRGKETINKTPHDAMEIIVQEKRSPLTIEEGVAIVTHFPEFLIKNNCFSLLASRHAGDKRVPAIWINASKNPNLGWCWDGNPHTWLGSASCKNRIS